MKGARMAPMALPLPLRQPVSPGEKPLPSLPSPTLTNPDLVLPDRFPDTISLSSSPQIVRPPSPSYLVEQHQRAQRSGPRYIPIKNGSETQTRHLALQHSGTVSRAETPDQGSPASHLQHRYSEAALRSSPTVGSADMSNSRQPRPTIDGRRASFASTSVNSEDYESMRIPEFVGAESDLETLTDTDFEAGSPGDEAYATAHLQATDAEQSSVTLMRAELILANAKKRLNLMDQNLRGAREIIVPLTAANLKRAASLHSASAQPTPYSRARYMAGSDMQASTRHESYAYTTTTDALGHSRGLSDSDGPAKLPERSYSSMSRTRLANIRTPVFRHTPSWTPTAAKGARNQELNGGASYTPHPVHGRDSNLQEDKFPTDSHYERSYTGLQSVSRPADIREQMHELKGRISSLKERALEERLRRRSIQTLRQTYPVTDSDNAAVKQRLKRSSSSIAIGNTFAYSPMNRSSTLSEDGRLGFNPGLGCATPSANSRPLHVTPGAPEGYASNQSYDRILEEQSADEFTDDYSDYSASADETALDMSDSADSVYEDAPDEPAVQQRHEDREDAFDYGNFFLHSSLGSFSRRRGESISSTDSGETARGPSIFQDVPATPETPQALREIERGLHGRTMSAESIVSLASFATAQEGLRSGQQTPALLAAEWPAPESKQERSPVLGEDRADSGVNIAQQLPVRAGSKNQSRSSTVQKSTFSSIPLAPTTVAVTALLDTNAQPLGLRDKALVFSLVESLKNICEQLQADDGNEHAKEILRNKLDGARRVLEGYGGTD